MANNEHPKFIEDSTICVLDFLNAFCICGVNTFILISGYFGIHISKKKIITIIVEVCIYTFILSTCYYLYEGKLLSALRSLFIIGQSKYWFIVDYIFLLPFTPLINKIFITWNNRKIIIFVSCLLLMTSYYGFIWRNNVNYNGYTLFQFITLYSLGMLIKKFQIKIKRSISGIVYLGSSLLIGALCTVFYLHHQLQLSWQMTFYNNPLVILSAIALFIYFNSFTFNSKFVNYVAKSSFAIYLFQSSPLVSNFMYNKIGQFLTGGVNIEWLIIIFLGLALLTVIVAITLDQAQLRINAKITNKISAINLIRNIKI